VAHEDADDATSADVLAPQPTRYAARAVREFPIGDAIIAARYGILFRRSRGLGGDRRPYFTAAFQERQRDARSVGRDSTFDWCWPD
jgi:hypothetical protein